MEPTSLPSTIPEVEALVLALYEPRPPEAISKIQESLLQLQKSPAGWQIAQGLLMRPDDKIKFFGALTLIVKLNTESSGLTEDAAEEILQSMITWLLESLGNGSGTLVIRKLCSALATFFIHFSNLWPKCVRHLVYCLDLGRSVPVKDLDDAPSTQTVVESLELPTLQAALWFAASFVEDAGKMDMASPKYVHMHERLLHNSQDVTDLLARALSPRAQGSANDAVNSINKVQEDAVKCYQSWILFAQRVSLSRTEVLITPLRTLVDPTLNCLANDAVYEATAELFTDILGNYSGFFTDLHYKSITSIFQSQWSRNRYQQLVQGDFDFDSVQFGQLMIAFGDARVEKLMNSADEQSQSFLAGLCGLLAASGYPVGEDRIFVPALEFWSTFVETMTDSMYSDEEEAKEWLPRAMSHVMQVVSNCWGKVRYPAVEVFASWDSTERTGFSDARKDVSDLLQSVYTISGPQLITHFADLLLQYIPTKSWAEIEAAAFCLGSLSDCISDESNCDQILSQVFASPFFDLLSQAQGPIPVRLRQTALSLLERYSEYFERHSEFLPAALNLLFDAVGDPLLGGPSSKSISTLCSSCRSILTGEAEAFLAHYRSLRSSQVTDSIAEERIVAAITSTIQAISDEKRKLQAFEQLLDCIKDDIERSLNLQSNPGILDLSNPLFGRGVDPSQTQDTQSPASVALQLSLRALRCLASAAKGIQATTENPVDLESEVRFRPPSEHLARLQNDIIGVMVQVQSSFPNSGEVVDVICHVLRAGFSETEPGPFVFPANITTEFFVRQAPGTPRIGTLVSTACSCMSSLNNGPERQVAENLSRLLPWVIALLHGLDDPGSDPELAQNGIEFAQRLMAKHAEVLLGLQPTSSLEFFFLFTLKVLNGSEPLPKVAAADFWTAFLSLKSLDPAVQSSVDTAMSHLGPWVAQSLVRNIGGGASRSELDKLSEPLKRLVVAHAAAPKWLEQALFDEASLPRSAVSADEKALFLRKVVSLRGARATNQVVRDFWLLCRGSDFAYAS